MWHLYSQLPRDKYLAAMRQKFDNPLCIFDERITGFVIGSFFAVAHYQPYEWNRRITSECNRAYGFVKETEGKVEIRFIRGKGMLAPGWLLFWTLASRGICLIVEFQDGAFFGSSFAWGLSLVCAVIVCAVSALESSLTDAGAEGEREVCKFLENPEEYYC